MEAIFIYVDQYYVLRPDQFVINLDTKYTMILAPYIDKWKSEMGSLYRQYHTYYMYF